MKLCLILLSAILSVSESLKVYSRTISSADLTKKIGLRYHNNQAKEKINWNNGMTVCVRFKYEQLGTSFLENVLFSIGQSKSTLVSFVIRWNVENAFPNSPNLGAIIFRKHDKPIFYFPWIGKNIGYSKYISVKIWHHLCLSFDVKKAILELVIVSTSYHILIN